MKRQIRVPKLEMRASFKPQSFDVESRTLDVVWSTGSRGKRYSYDGPYYEELAVDARSVKLDRLNAGAPVLNSHGSGGMFHPGKGLRDVIGVVERASIKDGVGVATIRLSSRPDVADLVRDIQEGIIRNVSVGYQVATYQELDEPAEDGLPILRATEWEPYEISFVAMPFDMSAQSRSLGASDFSDVVIDYKGDKMKKKNRDAVEEPKAEEPKAEEPKAEEPKAEERTLIAAQSQDAEIARQAEIRKIVKLAGLDESVADKLVRQKSSVEQSRAFVFEELENKTTIPTRSQKVEVGNMELSLQRREAATRALLNRAKPEKYALKEGDRAYRQGSLVDMARKFLQDEGVSGVLEMSRRELVTRALHSTSDFPEVLANTSNKSLRDAYEGAPNTYAPFVDQKNVSDFKEISSVQLGNGGKLMEVSEHGEYKRTTVEESAEKYRLKKHGLILGKTFELMVNDDLDAFTRIPARLGVRAREKENEIFWGLILANGLMADGVAYFDNAHGNLTGTGAVISVDSLGVGRSKMRLQTDLEGELMNVSAKYLIVPAALETKAQQFVATITPNANGSVNPFAGSLTVIAEPRLDASSGLSWYMAADKAQLAAAEMSLLDGAGPEITVREGFDVDGMEMKLRYIFGMKLIDHRAMYKNVGA